MLILVSLGWPSWSVTAEDPRAILAHDTQGQNLILNMNDKGFTVCVYNRTTSKIDDFLQNEAKGILQLS